MERWLRELARNYLSADVEVGRAMIALDIQAMPFEDGRFDLIWCSHVLEHVPNDARALREIHRVLAHGGNAIIQIPVWGTDTVEGDLAPDQRLIKYFQDDHVRRYGHDVVRRFQAAGLSVTVRSLEEVDLHLVLRYGLASMAANEVFVLTKNARASA